MFFKVLTRNIFFTENLFYICRTVTTKVDVMSKVFWIIGLCTLLCTSCKVNQTKQGTHVGRWVYKAELPEGLNVQSGRYDDQGVQKGTWKYRLNGTLYKKEVCKDSLIAITYYAPTRKVVEVGQAVLVSTLGGLHYYYTGSWFHYTEKGILTDVKQYELGILKHHTRVRP